MFKKLFMFVFVVFFISSGLCFAVDNVSTVNTQGQFQVQGAYGIGGAGGNSSIGISNGSLSPTSSIDLSHSFNSDINRGFPIPGNITFPGTPSYFGPATPGQNFIPLSKITKYSISWNYSSIENMVKDNSGWGDGLDIQIRRIVKLNKKEIKEVPDVVFTTITKPKNAIKVVQLAFGVIATTDDHKISVDNFAKLLEECHKAGGNVVHFLAEGVNRKMRATGWGIGIGNSVAVMSSGQGMGNVATAGTGYSNGTSGYVDRPWLQAIFLKVETKNGEPLQFLPPPIYKSIKSKDEQIKKLQEKIDKLESKENTKKHIEKTY